MTDTAKTDESSMMILNDAWRYVYGSEKDYLKAFETFDRSADVDAEALAGKAECLYYGWGVDINQKIATLMYKQAGERGSRWGRIRTWCCSKPFVDDEATLDELKQLAAQNFAAAQYNLGFCYHVGHGVGKDLQQAVHWYRRAADQGDVAAMESLAMCYYSGQGVEHKDAEKSIYWYRRAAEQEYAPAQYILGVRYKIGRNVEKDEKQAAFWYGKAAKQGYAPAQNYFALCYQYGQGVQKDEKQAVLWFDKAANQDYADAQHYLGLCYEYGRGVEKDIKLALYWYHKSADNGSTSALTALDRFK